MPLAKIHDADIHYDIKGEGEPVLLVAGLGGVASYWNPNLTAFTERYQVILHDHRGTGGSTRSEMRYSVELMADDLLRLMDVLKIEKAHLVGHSTGGAIGQVIAAIAPERIASLVLYASWAVHDNLMEVNMQLRRRIAMAMGEAEYHRTTPVFLYPPTYIRDNKEQLERDIAASIAGTSSKTILDARAAGILAFDGLQYHDRITCPTMAIVAEDDILTPPYASDIMVERIRGASLIKVPKGGHALSRSEPKIFNDAVLGFLAKHPIAQEAAA
ncbi:alpha/beta fold hydrolase [Rhodopseudomonas boonkerdii]|uniref:alpha/beta fold hydrolase n=1 Tax=Rhodopseudomonas boonkerdii TaxID=475937 RepID=UPI001E5ACAD3|nr:alpha/beta fold hydrolase [Rhodopseudomonas boonkerdii]UGV26117.1 alpha/beta fold hydrolase [Rhodopseudomonas boonkerdii]